MTISQHRLTGETFNLDNLPESQLLNGVQAGAALGIRPSTLAVWRSSGRYRLPFVKCGRLIRYRVSDIREFIAKRTRIHTGEGA